MTHETVEIESRNQHATASEPDRAPRRESRLGVALFTMRGMDEPIAELVRRVAETGYQSVEFVDRMEQEFDAAAIAEALEETGLEGAGVHVWLHELEADLEGLVRKYEPIGVDTFVVPYHPETNFQTRARVQALVERLDAVTAELAEHDCVLSYHPNHWDLIPFFDGPVLGRIPTLRLTDYVPPADVPTSLGSTAMAQFRRVENELIRRRNRLFDRAFIRAGAFENNGIGTLLRETPFGYIVTETDPRMQFEIDTSFFVQQGYDPTEVFELLGDRLASIHVKDVRTDRYTPGYWPSFVDAGEGELDYQAVADAARRTGVEWVLFENGHSSDAMNSIEGGYEMLRSVGLPSGPD